MLFLYPYLLGLSIIPLLFVWRSFKSSTHPFGKHFSKTMQHKLSLGISAHHTKRKHLLFLLVLILFIVALARPVKILQNFENQEHKPALIIALDVSASMHHTDIYPNRLTLALKKLTDFLSNITSTQVGIMFYANDAYMLYPLTQETKLLSTLLQDVNLSQKFAPNTNLFAALEGAQSLLGVHPSKQILLLSDGGADIARDKELDFLLSEHITLSVLSLAPKTNDALQTLSQKSGGTYQPYTWSDKDINILSKQIHSYPAKAEMFQYDITHFKELYSYPLWAAVFLLIFLFFPLKKIPLFILPVLYIITLHTPLQAGIFDFWHLYQAQEQSKTHAYNKALTHYQTLTPTPQIHYNIASILYIQGKYMRAIEYYKKALGKEKRYNAKVYYNIATAYTRLHKLSHAKEYYMKSLSTYPLSQTKENLAWISKALKMQKKNLHKAYQKLHFKAVANNAFAKDATFSDYAVKLHKLLPSQEERWFNSINKQSSHLYLEKISTTQRSADANLSY